MFRARTRVLGVMSALCCFYAASMAWSADSHTVEFRLVPWRAKHCEEQQVAVQHVKVLKSLGCQVESHDHGGHFDVRYRLPHWRKVAFPSDTEAHKWQKYLETMGFETRHSH